MSDHPEEAVDALEKLLAANDPQYQHQIIEWYRGEANRLLDAVAPALRKQGAEERDRELAARQGDLPPAVEMLLTLLPKNGQEAARTMLLAAFNLQVEDVAKIALAKGAEEERERLAAEFDEREQLSANNGQLGLAAGFQQSAAFCRDDSDYSPAFQDEYQRLWHATAASLRELLSAIKVWQDATEARCRLLSGREASDSLLAPDQALIDAAQRIAAGRPPMATDDRKELVERLREHAEAEAIVDLSLEKRVPVSDLAADAIESLEQELEKWKKMDRAVGAALDPDQEQASDHG